MMYPVILFHEDGSDYDIIIPDFPGCYSAADTQEEIQSMVQEAIETHMDGEEWEPPIPSNVANVAASEAAEEGFVMMVDVDLSFLEKKTERVNITVPSYLLRRIDRMARGVGKNRSQFLVDCALRCAPKKMASA